VSSTTYEQELEAAHTPQADNIRRQLMRLGDTPYTCTAEDIEIHFSDNWFIPASVMGEWRRQMVSRLSSSEPSPLPQPCREGVESQENSKPSSAKVTTPSQKSPPPFGEGGGVRPRREGGESVAPLMTCRFCLRQALGYCTRDGKRLPYREPLSLRLSDGRTFPLRFDCKACEMQVLRN
jgi:putative protease